MEINEFSKKIESAFLHHIGIKLSETQVSQFFYYMNFLLEKNKVMNLTAITEPDDVIIRHFVDSCILLKFQDDLNEEKVHTDNKVYVEDKDESKGNIYSDKNVHNISDEANGNNVRSNKINLSESKNIDKSNLNLCKEDFFKNKSLVDIGTGAGFPGFPIAIVCPDAKITLTDTLGKRVNFLEEAVDKIKISNTHIIKSRAEDFCRDANYREAFDFALARGVANLSVLSEYLLPAVKISGKMVSHKMDDVDDELNKSLNAIKILGGSFSKKLSYNLIDGEPKRSLVVINKISKTPNQYPRKAGMPAKNPL